MCEKYSNNWLVVKVLDPYPNQFKYEMVPTQKLLDFNFKSRFRVGEKVIFLNKANRPCKAKVLYNSRELWLLIIICKLYGIGGLITFYSHFNNLISILINSYLNFNYLINYR